jgi:predicted GNAT superfamily acetyltransferase
VTSVAAPPGVEVRPLAAPEEMSQCESLYRRVFGLRAEEGSLNSRLLVALARNSGIVVGAFAGDELVGFAFSFLAQDAGSGLAYQYSQTAAVLPDWQGCGVGRQLKFAQREVALARGIRWMRWAFDPFKFRNAHFNLDVLGAHATGLARDLYGARGYGLDAESSTHRLIVDWRLGSQRVSQIGEGRPPAEPPAQSCTAQPGTAQPDVAPVGVIRRQEEGTAFLVVPATWRPGGEPGELALKDRVLVAIESLLGEGLIGVSCTRLNEDVAVYRFRAPDESERGLSRP